MFKQILNSKIHRATVIQADLNYEGSITVDVNLLDLASILPYEKVLVVNANNGNRFETYAIEGERDSGIICLNGPAARLGTVGDIITIISFLYLSSQEISDHQPKIIYVNENNQLKR